MARRQVLIVRPGVIAVGQVEAGRQYRYAVDLINLSTKPVTLNGYFIAMASRSTRTQRTRIGLVLALSLTSAPTSARAGESGSAQERFLAQYPAASKKLEDYYRHLKIYFTRIEQNSSICDLEFSRNGDSIRVVELDGKRSEPYYAYVVDPELIFKLRQDTTKSPFFVTDLGKGGPSDYKSWANLVLSKARVAFAPYGADLTGPIRDLLTEKALKIKSVQESEDGTIKVDWEGVEPGIPKSRGSFSFSPDQCWALRDYSIRYVDRKDMRTKKPNPDFSEYAHIDYEGSDDGVPLVHRVQMWAGEGDSKHLWFTYDVQDISHELVPKDQFTLASFGIRTRPAPPPVPVMYYLLGLSAFCGLMVLVLYYLRNRSGRTSAVT